MTDERPLPGPGPSTRAIRAASSIPDDRQRPTSGAQRKEADLVADSAPALDAARAASR